jgi:GTP-binding protein Era
VSESETSLNSKRAGIIAVVGAANAGKSTLINRLADEAVSIVSPVAQTTRNLIRMILTEDRGQLVWIDTPGIHKATSPLGKRMNQLARQSVEGADVILFVVDASVRPSMEAEGWMRRLLFTDTPVVVGLNKSDAAQSYADAYRETWAAIEAEKETSRSVEWHSFSARKGAGVDELLHLLFGLVPAGPYLFPEDILTDYPRKLAIADAIREQYFHELKQELPHCLAIRVDEMDESGARWKIQATVFVDRPSQKGIVIGNKGRLLKKVQHRAQKTVEGMFDREVDISLWVKVEKNWNQNYFLLRQLGYTE